MLKDKKKLELSDVFLKPNEVFENGEYWYHGPLYNNIMVEVYVSKINDKMYVEFDNKYAPILIKDITVNAKFVKIN